MSRGGTEAGRFPEIALPAASSQVNLAAVDQLLGIDPDIRDRWPISLQNNVSGFILQDPRVSFSSDGSEKMLLEIVPESEDLPKPRTTNENSLYH